MRSIIIQGSSRSDGNSGKITRIIEERLQSKVVDLKKLSIHPYSYTHEYTGDDFLPVIREMVTYDTVIFITPVYWYAMSGLMKNFFDRITDCLKIEKETGRKLRGKKMAVIACGSEAQPTIGFFEPFKNSASYLGMQYLGDLHTWVNGTELDKEMLLNLERFMDKIRWDQEKQSGF